MRAGPVGIAALLSSTLPGPAFTALGSPLPVQALFGADIVPLDPFKLAVAEVTGTLTSVGLGAKTA